MDNKECEYCEDEIEGKAYFDKKLEGWVCKSCKKILDEKNKSR